MRYENLRFSCRRNRTSSWWTPQCIRISKSLSSEPTMRSKPNHHCQCSWETILLFNFTLQASSTIPVGGLLLVQISSFHKPWQTCFYCKPFTNSVFNIFLELWHCLHCDSDSYKLGDANGFCYHCVVELKQLTCLELCLFSGWTNNLKSPNFGSNKVIACIGINLGGWGVMTPLYFGVEGCGDALKYYSRL